MKIAAVQMVSTPDVGRNLEVAGRWVAQAAEAGAQLVALPENFAHMGRHERDKLACAETPGDGPIQRFLAGTARRHGLWLVGGSIPMAAGSPDHVYNTCLVHGPDGHLAARYNKIHRFAFDNGREQYDEGRVVAAGTAPVAVQAADWRVGLSICYDLRFPELYRALMSPPCDLIAVPSAFTHPTGEAHWQLLLRARAVENQCYVIAPAQGGRHESGRRTWGHTLVVDPWGEVLGEHAEGEGLVMASLERERLADVRRRLPALAHRVL